MYTFNSNSRRCVKYNHDKWKVLPLLNTGPVAFWHFSIFKTISIPVASAYNNL